MIFSIYHVFFGFRWVRFGNFGRLFLWVLYYEKVRCGTVFFTINSARVIEYILCIGHYWATSFLDRSNGEQPDKHKMFTERSGTLSYMELWHAPSGLFGNVFRSKGRQPGWYDSMERANGA